MQIPGVHPLNCCFWGRSGVKPRTCISYSFPDNPEAAYPRLHLGSTNLTHQGDFVRGKGTSPLKYMCNWELVRKEEKKEAVLCSFDVSWGSHWRRKEKDGVMELEWCTPESPSNKSHPNWELYKQPCPFHNIIKTVQANQKAVVWQVNKPLLCARYHIKVRHWAAWRI